MFALQSSQRVRYNKNTMIKNTMIPKRISPTPMKTAPSRLGGGASLRTPKVELFSVDTDDRHPSTSMVPLPADEIDGAMEPSDDAMDQSEWRRMS